MGWCKSALLALAGIGLIAGCTTSPMQQDLNDFQKQYGFDLRSWSSQAYSMQRSTTLSEEELLVYTRIFFNSVIEGNYNYSYEDEAEIYVRRLISYEMQRLFGTASLAEIEFQEAPANALFIYNQSCEQIYAIPLSDTQEPTINAIRELKRKYPGNFYYLYEVSFSLNPCYISTNSGDISLILMMTAHELVHDLLSGTKLGDCNSLEAHSIEDTVGVLLGYHFAQYVGTVLGYEVDPSVVEVNEENLIDDRPCTSVVREEYSNSLVKEFYELVDITTFYNEIKEVTTYSQVEQLIEKFS